jgi:hypothetical protein
VSLSKLRICLPLAPCSTPHKNTAVGRRSESNGRRLLSRINKQEAYRCEICVQSGKPTSFMLQRRAKEL